LRLFLFTVFLIIAIVAATKLSSVLLAAQKSSPSASDENVLLEGFAEIQPIDAHIHVYKDDPELDALIGRLSATCGAAAMCRSRASFSGGTLFGLRSTAV
jgi:hypothetical protein